MIVDHPRFDAPSVARVYEALSGDGGQARIVGGAVRNAILGRPITDIDFATTIAPAETTRRAEAAGFKVVPTGIAHGTVLLVPPDGEETFEVTTLREDVETDGRHAVVRFGTDWEADARRRDFTMNALYRDADGTLVDPLDGLADARAMRVRFIGDAHQRIREDGLRILRFFRFSAEYGGGELDAAGLDAADASVERLDALSGERIRAEFLKLLVAPFVLPVHDGMATGGHIERIVGEGHDRDRFARLVSRTDPGSPDALLRVAALLTSPDQARRAADRLRLSTREADRLVHAVSDAQALSEGAPVGVRETLYRWGAARLHDALRLAIAGGDLRWEESFRQIGDMSRPVFPLKGRDVVAAGLAAGPDIGTVLAEVEREWIAADFPQDDAVRTLLLASIRRLDR